MTTNNFIKRLEKLIEPEFVIWTNKDKGYESFDDNNVIICGENDNETFTIQIIKVKV